LADRVEQALMIAPKALQHQFEERHEREKKRRIEAEAQLQEIKHRLKEHREIGEKVTTINEQVKKSAGQIARQIMPLTSKVASLKQVVKNLYMKLGESEDMATYHMLCHCEEWDRLSGPVGSLLRQKSMEPQPCSNNKKQSSAKAPASKRGPKKGRK